MLPGVTPTYLTRVDDVRVSEREVVFDVFSRPEPERWATLQGDMFTVRIASPAANVMRIQVTHHKGRRQRGPWYALNATPQPLNVHESRDEIRLIGGKLVLIDRKSTRSELQSLRHLVCRL